ncbi:MAG: hypothetical protein ACPHCI_08910 [Solirubrobacterales bacterium]
MQYAIGGVALIWLILLTIGVLACVRQVALLSAGQFAGSEQAPKMDDQVIGPAIGTELSDELLTRLGYSGDPGPLISIFVTQSCPICLDLLPELVPARFESPVTVVIPGGTERIPAYFDDSVYDVQHTMVLDPEADSIMRELDLQAVPFMIEIRNGLVVSKTSVRGFDHVKRYVAEAEATSDEDVLAMVASQGSPETEPSEREASPV